MRRCILCSTAVLSTLVFAPTPASSAETVKSAQFVSGTVAKIPANTEGSLDASSPSELRFNYGTSVFTVPYEKITGTQVTDSAGRHLWKVPVPNLLKTNRLLTISYHDGDATAALTFKAASGSITALKEAIDQRRAPAPATAKVLPKTDTEEWWGDRYWRTPRNKDKWPSPAPADAQGTPAGTKF